MDTNLLDQHLHHIYESASSPSHWRACLDHISSAVGAKSAALALDNTRTSLCLTSKRVGFSDEQIQFIHEHAKKDIWLESMYKLKPTGFVVSDEQLEYRDYKRSEMYATWGKRFDLHHAIALICNVSGSLATRIAFHRGKGQGAFTEEHTRYLDILSPHIKRSLSLAQTFSSPFDYGLLNKQDRTASKTATMLVDAQHRLVSVDRDAEQILCDSPLRIEIGLNRVIEVDGFTRCELDSMIASFTRTEKLYDMGTACLRYLTIAQSVFAIKLSRYQPSESVRALLPAFAHDQPLVLLEISELKLNLEPSLLPLSAKLSRAEEEILHLLHHGMHPQQIAEMRNRSVQTIRTQIKGVREKFGAKSTNQLLALTSSRTTI